MKKREDEKSHGWFRLAVGLLVGGKRMRSARLETPTNFSHVQRRTVNNSPHTHRQPNHRATKNQLNSTNINIRVRIPGHKEDHNPTQNIIASLSRERLSIACQVFTSTIPISFAS